jgi:hypothetical protein
MRWPLVFTAGVGLIWSVVSGVYSLRDMSDDGGTYKSILRLGKARGSGAADE